MFNFNTTDGKHFQISERTTIDDQYTSSSVARSSIGKTEADGGCILWHCSHHNMRFRFARRSLSVVARNLHLVNYLCSYQPKIPKIPDVSPSGIKNPPQAEVLCWSFWPSIWAQDSRWSEGVRQNIAWNRSFEDSRSLFSGFCSKLGSKWPKVTACSPKQILYPALNFAIKSWVQGLGVTEDGHDRLAAFQRTCCWSVEKWGVVFVLPATPLGRSIWIGFLR